MSNKVKIVCNNTHYHGKTMNLPGMNDTQLSETGEVEVSEEIAEQLTAGSDWDYVGKKSPKKSKAVSQEEEESEEEEIEEDLDEETGKEDEPNAEEQAKQEQLDKDLRIALIQKFKGEEGTKELGKLAKAAGVTKPVIEKAKGKTDLINMLLAKMSVEDKVELLASSKTEE